ncbi:MAG TPA: hypothetical protein VGI00_04430 [Streptosporangiaceae bacterium]
MAGLLGITVIGAVLRARQSAALRGGAHPVTAFLDGYHTGLIMTIALMLAGVAVSYLALRRITPAPPASEELITASGATPVPAGDSA